MMMAELVALGGLMANTYETIHRPQRTGLGFPVPRRTGPMVDVSSHPEIFRCWNGRQVALSMRCAGAEPVGGQYAGRRHFGNAAVTGVFIPTARWDYWSQARQMQQANETDRPLYHVPGPFMSLHWGARERPLPWIDLFHTKES
jgi:hypothetical protein